MNMHRQEDHRSIISPGMIFGFFGVVALTQPLVAFKANRLVAGKGLDIFGLFSPVTAVSIACLIGFLCVALALPKLQAKLRLISALAGVLLSIVIVGVAAYDLIPEGSTLPRVSLSAGFWLLFATFSLAAADILKNMRPSVTMRVLTWFLVIALVVVIFKSGLLHNTSIMIEYLAHKDSFVTAVHQHIFLALGSLAIAFAFGFPLGIILYQLPILRKAVIGSLTMLQTIPSLALFGIMIPIFAWIGANFPGVREIGVSGIGVFPAFVALFLYSLLPVVSNTLLGLRAVAPAVQDAARGIGMTRTQILTSVLIPLSLPFILTAVRIVSVQNIGLAVIAGLIGGGGLGSLVFQGINQNAMDLILLGALPTVALALAFGVALDLVIDAFNHPSGKTSIS